MKLLRLKAITQPSVKKKITYSLRHPSWFSLQETTTNAAPGKLTSMLTFDSEIENSSDVNCSGAFFNYNNTIILINDMDFKWWKITHIIIIICFVSFVEFSFAQFFFYTAVVFAFNVDLSAMLMTKNIWF